MVDKMINWCWTVNTYKKEKRKGGYERQWWKLKCREKKKGKYKRKRKNKNICKETLWYLEINFQVIWTNIPTPFPSTLPTTIFFVHSL